MGIISPITYHWTHYQIDKWGRCGRSPPNCGSMHNYWDNCTVELIKYFFLDLVYFIFAIFPDIVFLDASFFRQYKFYLAFENSNCVDYVTEKFFDTLRSKLYKLWSFISGTLVVQRIESNCLIKKPINIYMFRIREAVPIVLNRRIYEDLGVKIII